LASIKSVEKQRRRSNSKGEAMSLWDIVAGISTSKQLDPDNDNETKSFWKKFNSATLDIINGDGLAYTNEGGFTWNIFGANVNFVCDLESLLEGWLGTYNHHDNKWAIGGLGLIFGPGANNTITIGTSLNLNYMVGHSNNFTVMRGRPEFSVTYSPWQVLGPDGSPIAGGFTARNRHKLMWLAISAFALLVAGFDIALNVLKNQLNGEEEKVNSAEEKVHKDQAEIDKYNSIVEAEQKAAEAQGQVVNPDAGGVPVDPTLAQEELEHAEHQHHSDEATLKSDEATLKKTETRYEWTIFSNIIAENRGIFLLKFLEYLCADVKTVKTELEDLTNTVTNISQATGEITDENKASVEQEIKNLEQIIDQLETLGSLTTQQEGLMLNLGIQVLRAENLKEDLEKKIKDYEAAAKSMADLAAWINALDAIM
jgi:hypothetical protein